jgi:hypothetical protein
LVIAPDNPNELVLRATFGLVVSTDAGATWDWVCENAIGYSGIEDPAMGAMSGGTVLAGLSTGLSQSASTGCSWSFAGGPMAGRRIVDLTVRRERPTSAVALAWEAQASDSGLLGYRSRFFLTDDDGATWASYGNGIDPSVLVLTVDVAASDPHRLYASGVRDVGTGRVASLFVSTDDAVTWIEHPAPFDTRQEQGLYIAAVDPNAADKVYLRTSGATSSRLLVTSDAGASYDVRFSGAPLLAFALSPDGEQLYFGGSSGLWAGASTDVTFEQRSSLSLTCLLATSDKLYACSDQLGGFIVGASQDGGLNFAPKLFLKTVRGPLECAGDASVAVCAASWPATRAVLGIMASDASSGVMTMEGGVADASIDEGSEASNAEPTADSAMMADIAGAPDVAPPIVVVPAAPEGSGCAVAMERDGSRSTSRTTCALAAVLLFLASLARRRSRAFAGSA